MVRIGKCKETDCNGELFICGKNYFCSWEQHQCNKCGKVYGEGYQEYLDKRNN